MTFKANNRDRYHAWRSENLDRVIRAGVPERIAVDNRQFWFLVQEGEELDGGWNVDWISETEATDLYNILAEFFSKEGDVGWDLMDRLRTRLDHRLD